ncbi:hypothetical protein MY04_3094 [Flammeovirga sp. MY04]|uniref:M14 family zinc carboxypeptidase n=1 Tax=Flammeovirga sp. MY04 TaxID=1191459 RepID=UPI000806281A|nr:M14 family zinc carboxypeptidase [Flammeovirga sp. MY04]ANQ50459.1 hypothetical protein MY04_3094 [Flammeovirga sp. MY04]
MRILGLLFSLFFITHLTVAQLSSPSRYLGYELGSNFTYHHQVINYLNEAHTAYPKKTLIHNYGTTSEGRPLTLLVISSEKNITRLDKLKSDNIIRAGLSDGKTSTDVPFVWLGYNVHGNEASGTEVALKVIHHLLEGDEVKLNDALDNLVVIIDPCLNPDGRERYVNDFRMKKGKFNNSSVGHWTHKERWPTGRYNHYLFDLNRDWAWQTQRESRLRYEVYKEYMPHVYVDFHEMMPQYSYFFGPPAEPIHQSITSWQRKYQRIASENYETLFKENQWDYFTEEIFDLLYPSYGDSWTSFNGAVGFTFEQGGHGVAGLEFKSTNIIQPITLKGRIEKHFETSMISIYTASENKKELLDQFEHFFDHSPNNGYQHFIIKDSFRKRKNIDRLLELMDRHQIAYSYATDDFNVTAFDYFSNSELKSKVNKGDIILNVHQPKGRALQVLMEPFTERTDSLTYDLTAWALPFAYGVEALAVKHKINHSFYSNQTFKNNSIEENGNTLFIPWSSVDNIKVLTSMMGVESVFYLDRDTVIQDMEFKKGDSFIFQPNKNLMKDLIKESSYKWLSLSEDDFNNSLIAFKKPKVSILGGAETNALDFGALWYYFDEILNYPMSIIDTENLTTSKVLKSDILIISDGRYSPNTKKVVDNFVKSGGKVILFEDAIKIMSENSLTALYESLNRTEVQETRSSRVKGRKATNMNAAGCVLKVSLNSESNISNGLEAYFNLKQNKTFLPLLNENYNLGVLNEDALVSGFMGHELQERMPNTSIITSEKLKNGTVIYFVESPVFRGFWWNGMHILSNAIFFPYNE